MPRTMPNPVTLPWSLEAIGKLVNDQAPNIPDLSELAVADAMMLACVCVAQRTGSNVSIDQAARALGVTREQYGDIRSAVMRLGEQMTRKLLAGRAPSPAILP